MLGEATFQRVLAKWYVSGQEIVRTLGEKFQLLDKRQISRILQLFCFYCLESMCIVQRRSSHFVTVQIKVTHIRNAKQEKQKNSGS